MGGLLPGERGRRSPKIADRWSDSPTERRIRDYCCERGIARSVFLGRVVGPGEPEWLPEDTTAALEWADWKETLCPGCGNPRHESFDPERATHYEAVPLNCYACAARDAEQREAVNAKSSNRFGDAAFDGLYVSVVERGDDGRT